MTNGVGQLVAEESRSELPMERAPARIKVVGVGGGGCNCVRRMLNHNVPGVKFVMVNTDIKSLESVRYGAEVLQIGEKVTHGWGAGGDSGMGARAAEESSSQLKKGLKDTELVFITAGMGGGTGTGAAPVVASLAKEMGALVVGVVTTQLPSAHAMAGVARTWIVIHNGLLEFMSQDAGIEAFRVAVTQGIMSVSELINVPVWTSPT